MKKNMKLIGQYGIQTRMLYVNTVTRTDSLTDTPRQQKQDLLHRDAVLSLFPISYYPHPAATTNHHIPPLLLAHSLSLCEVLTASLTATSLFHVCVCVSLIWRYERSSFPGCITQPASVFKAPIWVSLMVLNAF